MAKSYGIPMQGSKSRIADKIIDLLPSATHFYDLFGGGCANDEFIGKYNNSSLQRQSEKKYSTIYV